MKIFVFFLLLGAASLPSGTVADTIYQYRDGNGGILFTDKGQDQLPRSYTLLSVRKGWHDPTTQNFVLTPERRDRYDSYILTAARQHQVDPALIKSVMHAESLFNPRALSRVGAQGLMQLMPETAHYLGVDDAFDAWQNIMGGTRFLAYLSERFDQQDLVLAAYNAGEGNVRRHGGVPPFQETRGYIAKVNELLPRYRSHFSQLRRQEMEQRRLALQDTHYSSHHDGSLRADRP